MRTDHVEVSASRLGRSGEQFVRELSLFRHLFCADQGAGCVYEIRDADGSGNQSLEGNPSRASPMSVIFPRETRHGIGLSEGDSVLKKEFCRM
jgi:hypothetical protein